MISDRPERARPDPQVADGWLTPGRFALMLGALMVATFPRVLAGGETFFYRDYGSFTYPLAFFHREAFWRGELPLWNPLNNCGLPFLAQWNTMTLYPGSLIYLLLPLPWSLSFFCLAHMFLAGLGAYFLAFRWTGNRLAATVAGVTFAFNGLTWYALMWTNNIAALGWMPWVVLTAERAWREGGTRRIALAALTGAMQMLTGAPEVILLTWCATGALWLAQWVAGEGARARTFGRFAVVGLLVAGLAAAQLLPFLDLLAHSQRDTGFGDSQWAMSVTGLANYLVPRFRMQVGDFNPASQPNQYWTSSYYLGVGTIVLALLAVWRVRSRRTWVFAGLAAFSVLMALGNNGPIYAGLRRVFPQIGFMRFPIKFIVLATFALPFLSAHAVAWWRSLPAEKWSAERNRFLATGGLLVTLMALTAGCAAMRPQGAGEASATWLSALSRAGFLAATCGCLIALAAGRVSLPEPYLCVCLVLLLWLDVATHSRSLSPTVAGWVYNPDAIRRFYKWAEQLQPGESRAMPTTAAVAKIMYHAMEKPEDDFNGRRLGLFTDYNLLDHAAKVDGFYSLYLREQSALNFQLYTSTNGLEPLKDFLGVSWISHPTRATDWIERSTFLPMITAGQEPIFTDAASAFQGVTSQNFEPRKFVYLPAEARGLVGAKSQPAAKILSYEFAAERVGAEVETPAVAMVVVAQAFYHPWHAYVDGKPASLWRANYGFQALEVPAGRHHVNLVYEDRAFRVGAVVSVITLIGCLGALYFRARSQPAPG